MKICFLRHGEAEEKAPGMEDRNRPLTSYGASAVLNLARALRKEIKTFDVVLTSPMLRAFQTADIVANTFECKDKLAVSDNLLVDASPEDLIEDLKRHGAAKSVLIVGHQPHLGISVRFLTGEPGKEMRIEKGGCVLVTTPALRPGKGRILWHKSPLDPPKKIGTRTK